METKISKEQLMSIADHYGFKEWRELIFMHESAIEEVNTKLKILNNEFKIIHDHNPIEHIKTRVKKPDSIIEKLYRSLHLLIQLPIFLSSQARMTKVEIQIRTIAMDFWASLEHKIYYKYKNDAPDEIPEKLKESAEMIKNLDQQMLDIKKELDEYAEVD